MTAGSFAWRAVLEWGYADTRQSCTDAAHAHLACAATQWFPGYADYFALGMAVAVIASWRLTRGSEPRWIQRIGAAPDLLWAAALVLFVGYSTLLGTHGLAYVSPERSELRHFLNAAIVLLPPAAGRVRRPVARGVRAFLRWRPIAYTGLVSYGVYLWHQGFTDKAMIWTDSTPLHANFVLITTIAVACSVAAATVSWYWLERPINRRRDVPIRQLVPAARAEAVSAAPATDPTRAHLEGRFPCFDGLRAMAALMVVFHHAGVHHRVRAARRPAARARITRS